MKYYLTILLGIITWSCSQKENIKWSETLASNSFEDYFVFALENPNFSKKDALYDSLTKKIKSFDKMYFSYELTGNKFTNTLTPFDYYLIDSSSHIDFKERNVLIISISNKDSVLFNKNGYSLDNLDSKIFEFFLNPNQDPSLPNKKLEFVDGFGKAEISKGFF